MNNYAARYVPSLLALLVTGFQPAISMAQMGMGMGMGMGTPDARFVVAPEVGEQISDVTIVDDQGNPVNIRELASQSPYTVLTLGCLT
ncbi:uncharacterized protein METZ01_LOCUS89148 [marine metagenome]|uniref:Uncharacterized protein n=1 Tax=marine metagenome TaxID=408172 RepID=A0A381V803_9ZZZZ